MRLQFETTVLLAIIVGFAAAQDYEGEIESGPSWTNWEVPEGITLGQVAGLATDSDSNIHVFHRASRKWTEKSFNADNVYQEKSLGAIKENTFLTIDSSTGELMSEGGAGMFYLPHGMSTDIDDNIWVTDVALHQVLKFPKGSSEPSLVLGKAFEPGSDNEHFCKPTDVAVASNGVFYVADGYCNSRVMMFDADGKFLTSFGKPDLSMTTNASAPVGTLLVPHSVTLVEDWNMICVADREHKRIQCFAAGLQHVEHRPLPAGTFLKTSPGLGKIYAIRQKEHMLVGVTNNGKPSDLQKHAPNQLFLYNMENRQAATVKVELTSPHALTISQDGSVFIGEIDPPRIVKVTL